MSNALIVAKVIRRMMNCFTCNLPDEAASIMVSEDSNE